MIFFYTKVLKKSTPLNKIILYYDYFFGIQINVPFYKFSLRCECKPCESTPCGPGTRKILISSGSSFPGRCCDLYQCVKLFTGFPTEDQDQTFITPTSCGKLDGAVRQVKVILHFGLILIFHCLKYYFRRNGIQMIAQPVRAIKMDNIRAVILSAQEKIVGAAISPEVLTK